MNRTDFPLSASLAQVADIGVDTGPAQISREAVRRRIVVESNVRGRDVASFVAEASQRLTSTDRPLHEVLRDACATRMRPVLMTALVASLGFVPMALATGSGAEVQRPLATVVIGGLVTCTLLTLFVMPAVYGLFRGRAPRPRGGAVGE